MHSHAFNGEHSTRMLKFKLEATLISSTVHVRWPDNVGGWRCWFKQVAETIYLLQTLDFVNFGGFRGFRILDPPHCECGAWSKRRQAEMAIDHGESVDLNAVSGLTEVPLTPVSARHFEGPQFRKVRHFESRHSGFAGNSSRYCVLLFSHREI